eukprot:scaffold61045_cov44-Prasinocladus_malaysianus.AAC.1
MRRLFYSCPDRRVVHYSLVRTSVRTNCNASIFFPPQARVESAATGGFVSLCGGTLIAPNVILTAGHCQGMRYVYLKAPESISLTGYERHEVDTEETHPYYYNQLVPEYDVKVLKLKTSSNNSPVNLDDGTNTEAIEDQPIMAILGYGQTSCDSYPDDLTTPQACSGATAVTDLRYAFTSYVPTADCYSQYINLVT